MKCRFCLSHLKMKILKAADKVKMNLMKYEKIELIPDYNTYEYSKNYFG